MKLFEGIRPHDKMQVNFVTMPVTTSTKRKGAVNRLIARYSLKEKLNA